MTLDAFLQELTERAPEWIREDSRVLLTLNTRASARKVFDAIVKIREAEHSEVPIHLISADVTPLDRLEKIAQIRLGTACLVVSTQTVEAGVDIDMDLVIRDFAPFDSLVQVAGRCNRNNRSGVHGGVVELVCLKNSVGRKYSDMVYDQELLGATYDVLGSEESLLEEDVLDMSLKYFALLKQRRNLGIDFTEQFLRWEEFEDVRRLLRGKDRDEVSFVVQSDPKSEVVISELGRAVSIKDRWERRSALRALAGQLAKRSVTVYASRDWNPVDFADPVGPFWILRKEYYSPETGIDFPREREGGLCVF